MAVRPGRELFDIKINCLVIKMSLNYETLGVVIDNGALVIEFAG